MIILQKLIEEKEGTTLVVCYDIACKLVAHIKVLMSCIIVQWDELRPVYNPCYRLMCDALHYCRQVKFD